MELLRSLQEVGQQDVDLVGGKAANLGELLKRELPVPPGYVLLTTAYQQFLIAYSMQDDVKLLAEAIDLSRPVSIEQASSSIRMLFEQGTVSEGVSQAILAACQDLGCGSVAVRSFATAEDLASGSFAGQQESYLSLSGVEQVLIKKGLASSAVKSSARYSPGRSSSHGAIVAREYGIPAVSNVRGAMRHIKDGQVITVDGTEGRVYVDEPIVDNPVS